LYVLLDLLINTIVSLYKTEIMIQDIAGDWTFSEEFECGTDLGIAHFTQKGTTISGYLSYIEKVEDEEPFDVIQTVSGEISGHHLKLQGTKATTKEGLEINREPSPMRERLLGTALIQKMFVASLSLKEYSIGLLIVKYFLITSFIL